MRQRIILADTQVIFRAGAARVLAIEDDLRVVEQCADITQLLQAIDSLRSAIVVFPSSITNDLPALLDRIMRAGSRSVVIVEHGATVDDTISGRAEGLLQRSVAGPQLVECLRRVARGERCVQGPQVTLTIVPDRVGARVLKRLTPKELQMVALVTDGGKNKEIAAQLGTTEQVVKNYLRSIYDKTGVSDRLELTLFTMHHPALAEAARLARNELEEALAGVIAPSAVPAPPPAPKPRQASRRPISPA